MINKANTDKLIVRSLKKVIDTPINHSLFLKTKDLIDSLKLEVFYQENFTIVTFSDKKGVVGAGTSKCSPIDEYDEIMGYNKALKRAIESVIVNEIVKSM